MTNSRPRTGKHTNTQTQTDRFITMLRQATTFVQVAWDINKRRHDDRRYADHTLAIR